MEAVNEYGNQVLRTPTDLTLYTFPPEDQVYLKTWKTSSWHDQPIPKWNEAHLVTLTTHSALELLGITLWAHHTQVRRDHKA